MYPATMSPTLPVGLIEVLESRIAPAGLHLIPAGQPSTASDNYSSTTSGFHSTSNLDATFDAADTFGANFVGGTKTFYIHLKAGDTLEQYTNTLRDFIHVSSGQAIAFFVDKNGDNDLQSDELTGLSLGKGAALSIAGSVDGDIVTNFNDATGKINATGLISNLQSIKSITSMDNANSIVAGGNITNLINAKTVNKILAGSAANGFKYNFNAADPNGAATDGTLSVAPAAKQLGSSIVNVSLDQTDLIQAGDGGAGAAGGSISSITLNSDTTGFVLKAGSGGAGTSTVLTGGAGGSVTTILVKGAQDGLGSGTPNSAGTDFTDINNPVAQSNLAAIQVVAGNGGAGGVNGAIFGNGGLGGRIFGVNVGFQKIGTRLQQSPDIVADSVLLKAGSGGDGKLAGAAGSVIASNVVTLTSDADNHAIEMAAGAGGNSLAGSANGRSGAGGSIVAVSASDINPSATSADVFVHAGAGGLTTGATSNGGAGGAVSGVRVVSFNDVIDAGNGANGTALAGAGGFVRGIVIDSTVNGIINHNTAIHAGTGGGAATGAAGGSVATVRVIGADLGKISAALPGFVITGGDAGSGSTGNGGLGGGVTDVQVVDLDVTGADGVFFVHGGRGGDGGRLGGFGGGLSNVTLAADDLSFDVKAGDGGDSTTAGNGGRGGSIITTSLNSTDLPVNAATLATGNVFAGTGGNGSGAAGFGGAGGGLSFVNAITDGNVSVLAGAGGKSTAPARRAAAARWRDQV